MRTEASQPQVTVVLPTYNRSDLLKECLHSIEHLAFPRERFELIVVDDGSSDGTPAVLSEFVAATPIQASFFTQRNAGPASARNLAISKARGSYIAFTDDDCRVDPHWLDRLLAGFADETVAGVGGAVRTASRGIISDYTDYRNIIGSIVEGGDVPPFIITANACYRKAVLLEVGGFDGHISHPGGEDTDLSWRVVDRGYTLRLEPEAVVYHLHKTRLGDFLASCYNYGQGERYVTEKRGMPVKTDAPRAVARKLFSPRYLAYHVKRYALTDGLRWDRAVAYALLDHAREWQWWRGYWSLDSSVGIRV